jgi:hypothetical protein
MADPRTIVGALVSARAQHVTNSAECHRRYHARMKEKRVVGVVIGSTTSVPPGGRRASTFITAVYTFGGGVVKQKILNIRSVKAFDGTGDNDGLPQPPPPLSPEPVVLARESNIPVAAGDVNRSDDTVDPSVDARDVYQTPQFVTMHDVAWY